MIALIVLPLRSFFSDTRIEAGGLVDKQEEEVEEVDVVGFHSSDSDLPPG